MNPTAKKIWNIATWVVIGIILLVAAAVTLPPLFGVKTLNVLTPSMSHLNEESDVKAEDIEGKVGQLPPGTLIYVVPTDIESVERYDVVTMTVSGSYLTHRVVDLTVTADGAPALITQGDANTNADGVLTEDRLVGKVVFSIPRLGGIVNALKQSPGVYFGIAGALLLILLTFVPDIVDGLMKKDDPTDPTDPTDSADPADSTDSADPTAPEASENAPAPPADN